VIFIGTPAFALWFERSLSRAGMWEGFVQDLQILAVGSVFCGLVRWPKDTPVSEQLFYGIWLGVPIFIVEVVLFVIASRL
jgi:hypothetical protein